MAYSTLDTLRTARLNPDLGVDDSDNTWGTTTQRNAYLQAAFSQLWPIMARQLRQTVTVIEGQTQYDLTTLGKALRQIERIDLLDASGEVVDTIRSWQLFHDESTDPLKELLLIPPIGDPSLSMVLYGWASYKIPASGSDTCDLPVALEYVVSLGGVYNAYRAKYNSYINFTRLQNENRSNAVSAAELMELMRLARADWQDALKRNQIEFSAPHRAQRNIS